MSVLSLMWSFIQRDALIATSYRAAFLLPLLSVGLAVPILYFLSKIFAGADTEALGSYNGAFFAFILLNLLGVARVSSPLFLLIPIHYFRGSCEPTTIFWCAHSSF